VQNPVLVERLGDHLAVEGGHLGDHLEGYLELVSLLEMQRQNLRSLEHLRFLRKTFDY
jgi:hypothetical protein